MVGVEGSVGSVEGSSVVEVEDVVVGCSLMLQIKTSPQAKGMMLCCQALEGFCSDRSFSRASKRGFSPVVMNT